MLYDLQINVFRMGDVEFLGVFIINFESCPSKYMCGNPCTCLFSDLYSVLRIF